MAIKIRLATLEDAQALLDIYQYYVTDTAITFEYEPPALAEFTRRMREVMQVYPYLVAEEEGRLLGYAYGSRFHPRDAYAWSAEVTIYLDKDSRGKGIGRLLYQELEVALRHMGILNLYACIASPIVEDRYLSNASRTFHETLGYQLVGTFHQSGYKFQTWYNMIWMEKIIGEHENQVGEVKPFSGYLGDRES